ncbi:MAG: gliding motility-associated C-terminal domain-containing protein [Bacteroidota bacterium]
MKRILSLVVLSLILYHLDAQDDRFDCNGDLIITLYGNNFGNTNAHNISVTDDEATFNDLTTFFNLRVNSTAFNSVDRYIYGIAGNDIIRLKSDGSFDNLGQPSYFPLFVQSFAGDFDSEGIYWIHERSTSRFIGIDINNGLAEVAQLQLQWHPSTGNSGPFLNDIDDLVFDPLEPTIMWTYQRYGESPFGTRGHLLRVDMDPASANYGFIYSEGALSPSVIIHLGALFFDSKGVLFGYGGVTSPSNQNQLIKIDRNPTEAVYIATGPAASANDGCSCPFSMYLTKATEDSYNVCVSELMRFDYVIGNSSNIVPEGVVFNDSFPPGFEIVNIEFSENFGKVTGGTGIGTNKLEITDITFSNKEVEFSVFVRPSPVSGSYSIQADLTSLPSRFGSRLVSDDPETFFNDDPTRFVVDYEFFPNNFDIGDDVIMCEGEIANFEASLPLPGTEVTWNGSGVGTTYSTQLPGMIVAEAVLGGCNAFDTVMVEVVPYPDPKIGEDQSFCDGEARQIGVPEDPNYLYTWNIGEFSNTIEVTESGTYILKVDDRGCISYDTIEIENIPYPDLELGADLAFCEGEFRQLGIPSNPDFEFSWNTGDDASTIEVSETGMYILEVNNRGCISYDTATVETIPFPEPNLGDDLILCLGDVRTIGVPNNSNYFFTWNTGDFSNSIVVEESGTYVLEVNHRGCISYDTTEIIFAFEEFELGFDDIAVCEGTPIMVDAHNPFEAEYNWTKSDGSTLNESMLTIDKSTPDMSGVYSIEMEYLECKYDNSFEILVNPLPEIELEQEVTYDICDSIHLGVIADPLLNLSWTPAEVVNCDDCDNILAMIIRDTYFEVTATDEIGCSTKDSIFVQIEDTGLGAPVNIPNVFSPNDDNVNDEFIVRPLCYEIKEFKIYDRWGNMVYTKDMQPNSDEVRWDGFNQIGLCKNGVYVWYGLFKFINSGDEVLLSGDVTLLR